LGFEKVSLVRRIFRVHESRPALELENGFSIPLAIARDSEGFACFIHLALVPTYKVLACSQVLRDMCDSSYHLREESVRSNQDRLCSYLQQQPLQAWQA
jgi:hypothetical protein